MNLMKNMLVCVFILTIYTLSGSSVASGLRPPSPVRLTSNNMDLVLKWNPPAGEAGDLLYTAEYRPVLHELSPKEWIPVCVKISVLKCDLSHLNPLIFVFGTYVGRVVTERGKERSEWGESNKLTLDRDTVIGPPSVTLFSHRGNIEVSITDPEFSISSLRDVYASPSYNITYWRDGQREKAKKHTAVKQNRVVIDELDPWTKYCVQVQIHTDLNLNPSRTSSTVCESTANREEAPWVVAVVIFVIMALVITLVVLIVVYRKKISDFLWPKVSLPHSFKQLRGPLNSPMYLAMSDSQTPEEVCHPVSVVTQHGTVEEERLLQEDQRRVEEECPPQADRTTQEEQDLQGDQRRVEEEHSMQADRTAEEERSLKAARSSCSTECDVTEREGQKEETP